MESIFLKYLKEKLSIIVYLVLLNKSEVELADYISWFNNHCMHSTLVYLSFIEFLKNKIKKNCLDFCCHSRRLRLSFFDS